MLDHDLYRKDQNLSCEVNIRSQLLGHHLKILVFSNKNVIWSKNLPEYVYSLIIKAIIRRN